MTLRPVALGAAWLAAAAAATAVSWTAVFVVGDAVSPSRARQLTVQEAARELASPTAPGPSGTSQAPGTTSAAPPSTSRPPSGTPPTTASVSAPRTAAGIGGTAAVRCVGGVPRYVYRVPKPGFTAKPDEGNGEARFESDSHRTDFAASCSGGVPTISVRERSESHDGGGGDD